jgi:hypothetical protein
LSASSSPSETPVRDVTGGGTRDQPGRGRRRIYSPLHWEPVDPEHFEEVAEKRDELVLVLSELEVKVVSPMEAHELSRSRAGGLQMLVLPPPPPPHTEKLSEEMLRHGPVLVLFRAKVTVREAYGLLYSHLAASTPAPGPGKGPCDPTSTPGGWKGVDVLKDLVGFTSL